MEDGMIMHESSYWSTYQLEIVPKLKELDILAKTSARGINIAKFARLLEISEAELTRIMKKRGIKKLNKNNICEALSEGSSELCQMYRRETEKGSPFVYTREDIAYIYDLDIDRLNAVCDELGIIETTPYFFKEIFERMPSKGDKNQKTNATT